MNTYIQRINRFVVPLAVVFCATSLQAATHYVPDDYATIQQAIDGVEPADTILVRPGIYFEHLQIVDKGLTLESTDGPEVTILDGDGAGRLLTLSGSFPFTVRGFTLQNGWASAGGAAYAWRARGTLENCRIINNSAYNGGAFYAVYGASLTALDSIVSGNTAVYNGGAGYGTIGYVNFERSLVEGNTAGTYGGAAVGYGFCGSANVTDSFLVGNSAGVAGGALYTRGTTRCMPHARATNTLMAHNAAPRGGAVASEYAGRAWLANVTVADNEAEEGGGFYAVEGSYHLILNTIFYFNSTPPVFSLTNYWGYLNGLAGTDMEGGVVYGFEGDGTNISADPLFVDRLNGDYRLSAGSPCIDAGVPSVSWLNAPDHDILGEARPQDLGFDIGAYEYSLARIDAAVKIDPETLNRCNPEGWVTVYLTLPPEYDPADVIVPLTHVDGLFPAIKADVQEGVLMLKFDREPITQYLDEAGVFELTVTGEVEGQARFTGVGSIRVIDPCAE